jgi:hypothetical protein
MAKQLQNRNAEEIIDLYFIENRARLLDIASFLDRVDRYGASDEGKEDFRYRAFVKALKVLLETPENRTKALQMVFSDMTAEPLEKATEKGAYGAWEDASHEGD